ncbi:trehalose-phosphatase [Acidiphilium sp.]|uniref:trehalose-phosphatase n=1 Tax=Acidiphilium sp. TaxID=527 RepID=UPI003D07C46F
MTRDHALFLDLDGTLLDFAATPAEVVVPRDLPRLMADLAAGRDGALAVLSGRTLADIDAVTGSPLPAGAEHGFVCRDPVGAIHHPIETTANRPAWRQALCEAAATMPGVVIEEKQFTLVAHFRRAPVYGPALHALIDRLIADDPDVEILAAAMAWEIRPTGVDKGGALRWFMGRPPFAGRSPVFVGDDTTDEAAIAAARALGGVGLHVHRDFAGSTSAVRIWLARAVTAPCR